MMAALAGAPVQAAETSKGMYLVSLDANGQEALYLNLGTIEERPGRTFRFWNLYVESDDHVEENVKYRQIWAEIKCPARTIQTLKAVEYGPDGNVIFTLEDGGKAKTIVPDSRADDMREAVCTPGALRNLDPDKLSRDTGDAIANFDAFVVEFRKTKGPVDGAESAKAPVALTEVTNESVRADDFIDRAIDDLKAGRDDGALDNLDKAVALGTRDPNAFLGRAGIYSRKGDLENAKANYDRAIDLDPSNGTAYVGRAELLQELGDNEGTILDANRALKLMLAGAYIYDIRGWAYIGTEQWDLASADFDAALKLEPEDGQAWAGRGAADNGRDNYEQALKDFDRALAIQPDKDWIYARRGAAYLVIGNYDAAIADFSKAIELNPDNKEAAILRKTAELAKAEKSGAVAAKTIS